MKNTFGNNITLTIFGESHGEAIGALIDGLASGIKINEDFIKSQLAKRRPYGKISTSRVEEDNFKIISGVFNGYSTGTPICIIIENNKQHSSDYSLTKDIARPGHADYTGHVKYKGYEDYRGGGHFSGRLTAPIVAASAIIIDALKNKGIEIGSHIKQTGNIFDAEFNDYSKEIQKLNEEDFALIDLNKKEEMLNYILEASKNGDSVGGILETAVIGLEAGLGEPYFDSIESVLSHALFSIGGVKGIEFGMGFDMVNHLGSKVNDSFYYDENKKVNAYTNNNGGINGGISNGLPITFKTIIKPTPSIFKEQDTINFQTKENVKLQLKGRHDPAIFHRARVVVDSLTAFVIADFLVGKYGTDYLGE